MTREGTHRVSNLQAGAGPEARDELTVQTGGVEGQRQLVWDTLELQLHLGANFLATAVSLVVEANAWLRSAKRIKGAAATTARLLVLQHDKNSNGFQLIYMT